MANHGAAVAHAGYAPEPRCVACGIPLLPWRSATAVEADLAVAVRLHSRWLPQSDTSGMRAAGALKDSAELMYGFAADVLACGRCGSLYRDPGSVPADIQQRYRDDPYPPATLDRLFDRYTESYKRDHRWMTTQLTPPPRRRVPTSRERPRLLEVGSHVGAFLAYASGHGWAAHGVDVGTAVTEYARCRGAYACVGEFSPADYPSGGLDAVWILNCFEHLPAPAALLAEVHRMLRPHGRLVLRTPRAEGISALYAARPRRLGQIALTEDNALGVPFPCCYSEQALTALLHAAGFQNVEVRRRRLVNVGPALGGPMGLPPLRATIRAAAGRAGLWAWSHTSADPRAWMDVTALAAVVNDDSSHQPQPGSPCQPNAQWEPK